MARGHTLDLTHPGQIWAILGPTNTGKTHLALQRMLAHRSGMIGLPLRLLAQEVYERVVQAKGPDQVALITGEEKRVPPQARYWVCTVESMPVDKPVACLVVDEVQLAADRARGHVFTDRLLRARGVAETWFLGSDTIEPVLEQLVPTVRIERKPRLSRLSWAGFRKLTTLPPRSAVVGFSVRRVYELAERLRSRHGGAAVVLGALSPRARNAQVALYQNGDVQHMVATDAIGMGLNLDVHHVALAGVHKYDGRQHRPLEAAELAQIAGRAGRWRRDGTFGTTSSAGALEPEMVEAIEAHAFPVLRRLWWRNPELDFTSDEALLDSLDAPAPSRLLRTVRDADDVRALRRLLRDEEVLDRTTTEPRRRLLWEVCGVPDFGNLLPEHHAGLLAELYQQLLDHHGTLPESWLEAEIARLDRPDGDLGQLMGRIAAIRVWTYLSHRDDWLDDPRRWQDWTRAIEDRLSDALHDKLTARFLDRRASALVRHEAAADDDEDPVPELLPGGRVTLAGQPLGRLRGLDFELEDRARATRPVLRAARRALAPLLAERVEALVDSPDGAFGVDPEGGVRWDGTVVSRLLPGTDWRRPRMRLLRQDWVSGPDRGRIDQRLQRWLQGWLEDVTAEPDLPAAAGPTARGLAFAVSQALGAVPTRSVQELVDALSPDDRSLLGQGGVRVGRSWVTSRSMLERSGAKRALWHAHHGEPSGVPGDGGATPFQGRVSRSAAEAFGLQRAGPWWIRADVYERLLRDGARGARALDLDREVFEALASHLPRPPRRGRSRGRGGRSRRSRGRRRGRPDDERW